MSTYPLRRFAGTFTPMNQAYSVYEVIVYIRDGTAVVVGVALV